MIFTPLTYPQYVRERPILRPLISPALTRVPQTDHRASSELRELEDAIQNDKVLPVVIRNPDIIGLMTLELHSDNLYIRTIVGKFKPQWLDEVIPLLVRIAKSKDKKFVKCGGRKGWKKVLKPFGFEPYGKYYIVEVT